MPMYSALYPNGEWFRQHLNWTLVLYEIIGGGIGMVIYFAILEITDIFNLLLIGLSLYMIGWIYLLVWNLRHKGRSVWNIFYRFIPCVGWIVFLCRSNKEQLLEENAKKEKHQKVIDDYWAGHGGKPTIL